MRKWLSISLVVVIVCWFAAAYGMRNMQKPPQPAPQQSEADQKMVDLAADVVYPYDLGNDSSVICFVGNFIGHHNGAVITCDSAVRYSDQRLECFGNVLINKNTTYVYGDRADYNGLINEAHVYSPLIKVVDGDATLYTYRFKFDTKLNIGEYDDGGVIINRDNLLESERGFYYADSREIVGVDRVEMRNDTYQMNGDSVVYNIETDYARFFTNTNIWNEKGEYIYADRGNYENGSERYIITRNGYILTENHEVWSDSIDYSRGDGYALFRHNIQIDDREHKVLAFGDRGEYWEEAEDALLTRDPSLIEYDPEQGDSLYMRADTIILRTRSTMRDREESLAEAEEDTSRERMTPDGEQENDGEASESAPAEQKSATPRPETDAPSEEEGAADDTQHDDSAEVQRDDTDEHIFAADTLPRPLGADSLISERLHPEGADSLAATHPDAEIDAESEEEAEIPLSELSKEERRARLREIAEQERAEKKAAAEVRKREKQAALKAKLDSIGERRIAKRNIQLQKQQRRDSIANAKVKAREEARKLKHIARLTRKGIKIKPLDASVLAQIDSTVNADMAYYDSLVHAQLDSILASWVADTLLRDTVALDTAEVDTVYRLVRGFRNVRIYRSDFQAVCDSISSSTLDSVIRLYIEPVMWHEENQITSEVADIHTKNQKLDFAEFSGKPMMISKIDTLHFDQVAGKTMFSYFRDNEIYRDDVNGNAQTIYYMQEDDSPEVQGLMYIESGDMTFYIEDKQVSAITYRGSPNYVLYPMDKIPETQPLFLQGFTWQEERRPARDSVFTRNIRPSQRAEKEALPRPRFPISSRIEEYKQRLIDSRRWLDRHEVLSGDIIEWLDRNTDWREQNERSQQTYNRRRNR